MTFNLFLQFTGFVSYQAFALGAAEANPVVRDKLANDWGINLQQNAGVCTAALDICVQTQPALNDNAGIDRDGLGVYVCNYRFPLGTPAIAPLTLRLRHL